MKCQHPFPVPNAIGNTNLWRFFMPCWGHPKLYENGWEPPCFFACGRRKRSRPYSFPHGRPDGDTGAQNHRNEHFSKPTEGGIQHGGICVPAIGKAVMYVGRHILSELLSWKNWFCKICARSFPSHHSAKTIL